MLPEHLQKNFSASYCFLVNGWSIFSSANRCVSLVGVEMRKSLISCLVYALVHLVSFVLFRWAKNGAPYSRLGHIIALNIFTATSGTCPAALDNLVRLFDLFFSSCMYGLYVSL